MISEFKESYVLITDEHDDIRGFATFLSDIFEQFSSQNVIIDLLKYDGAELTDLLSYLELSNSHRASRHSFVIVNSALSSDQIPEELMVVPSLQEAIDVVQMEDIERDLGF
jgi:hypothetical protein